MDRKIENTKQLESKQNAGKVMLSISLLTILITSFAFINYFFFSQAIETGEKQKRTEILMGFNPAENVDVVEVNSKAFGEYYKAKTGLSVKTFIATDYTALVEALRSGKIDFAWLPPFSYIKAEEIADAKVLLKAVRHGQASFYSVIITKHDSGIKTISDLKGRTMAWVDPSSTSGHIFPKANIMSRYGIDPDNFFKQQVFAGSHDALVLAVLNGTVDAGATFANDKKATNGSWHLFLKTAEEKKKIRVVYVSDPITGDTVTTTNKFYKENKELVDKTKKILLDMGKTEDGKKILRALYRIDSLVPAHSKDYEAIRAAAKILKI